MTEIYCPDSKIVKEQLIRLYNETSNIEALYILDLNKPMENRSAGVFEQIDKSEFIKESDHYRLRRY